MKYKCSTVVYLVVVLFVAVLVMGAAPSSILPNIGEMKKNTYTNKYFDIKFVIPKDMTYISREEIDKSIDERNEELLKKNIATEEGIEIIKKRRMSMLRAQKGDFSDFSIDFFCSDLNTFQDLNLDTYMEEKFESMKKVMESSGYKSEGNIVSTKGKLGKYEYRYIEVKLKYGDKTYKSRYYCRIQDEYLLCINMIYLKDDELNKLIKAFK